MILPSECSLLQSPSRGLLTFPSFLGSPVVTPCRFHTALGAVPPLLDTCAPIDWTGKTEAGAQVSMEDPGSMMPRAGSQISESDLSTSDAPQG